MSKFISLCFRNHNEQLFSGLLQSIENELVLSHSTATPPRLISSTGLTTILINPSEMCEVKDKSICVGIMTQKPETWHLPGGDIPDGNFALIRADQHTLELVTDATSSRIIWYYQNEDFLIASTSQRAIIMLLGTFEPNDKTYSWFLTSGYHGPDMGWDKRLKYVHSNQSRLILNRETWELTEETPSFTFEYIQKPVSEHYDFYKKSISQAFSNLTLNPDQWAIPLSGGYDSRTILLLLPERKKFKTITWGQKNSREIPLSDAFIAQKLAKKLNQPHKFYPLDPAELPFSELLDRFLIAGEGRMDKIGGYLDGFEVWDQIQKENIQGIMRGALPMSISSVPQNMEEVFSHLETPEFKQIFPEEPDFIHDFSPKVFPDYLLKKPGESLAEYRDRLFILYWNPGRISAFNDVKLNHTETLLPFCLKEVIDIYRQLPDQSRSEKKLQKRLVQSLTPNVDFANIDSNINLRAYLKSLDVRNEMLDLLSDPTSKNILPANFLNYLIQNLSTNGLEYQDRRYSKKIVLKKKIKSFLPEHFYNWRKSPRPNTDYTKIALRACIILRMNQVLVNDTAFLTKIQLPERIS
ncbi:MAG: hypothetical protein KDE26_05210 [Bacteroidetes bacterium]|nr:hypothetical protein [Bacteroidota bacterium]